MIENQQGTMGLLPIPTWPAPSAINTYCAADQNPGRLPGFGITLRGKNFLLYELLHQYYSSTFT